MPTIGAALLIYAGAAKYTGYILRNRAVGFIGLISYSLYLIHWPIIVFAKTLSEDIGHSFSLPFFAKIPILVVSICFASLMYYFIEQPFRKNIPKIKFKQLLLLCRWSILIILFLLLGCSIFYSNGWLWRSQPASIDYKIKDISKYHVQNWGGAGFSHEGIKYGELPADIILMGDSHSGMLETGIVDEIAKPYKMSVYGISGGHDTFDEDGNLDLVHNKYTSSLLLPGLYGKGNSIFPEKWSKQSSIDAKIDLINNINKAKHSILIYSASYANQINNAISSNSGKSLGINTSTMDNYNEYKPFTDSLNKLLKIIKGHKLVLIGDVPASSGFNTLNCLSPHLRWFHFRCDFRQKEDSTNIGAINVNKILKEYAYKHENVYFINPYDTFCEDGYCSNVDNNGTPYYSDGTHLSKTGSIYFISHIKNQLLDIMNKQNQIFTK